MRKHADTTKIETLGLNDELRIYATPGEDRAARAKRIANAVEQIERMSNGAKRFRCRSVETHTTVTRIMTRAEVEAALDISLGI